MGFMHGYMKYTQPLFIQGIMPIKSLYDSKVSRGALLSVALEKSGLFWLAAQSKSREREETLRRTG